MDLDEVQDLKWWSMFGPDCARNESVDQSSKQQAAKECGLMNVVGQMPKRVTVVGRNE